MYLDILQDMCKCFPIYSSSSYYDTYMVKGYKGEFFTRFDIYIFTAMLHKVATKARFRRRTFSAKLNVLNSK